MGRRRRPILPIALHSGFVLLLLALLCALAPIGADAADGDGLRTRPDLGFRHGDHGFGVELSHRYRFESWDARAPSTDGIHGLRTRIGLRYRWRDRISLFAEGQETRVLSLAPSTSGAGLAYRTFSPGGDDSSTESIRVRQLNLGLHGEEGQVRLGRQDIKLGTALTYEDAAWKWLRKSRVAERLVGTVGWTNGERAYDAIDVQSHAIDGHFVELFAAQPTTGLFDIEDAYERQKQITFGGASWIVKPGTWLRDTELGGFFIAYVDDRDPDDTLGLEGEIEVYTLGVSSLSVRELGPGRLDTLLWWAFQFGDYTALRGDRGADELDHLAFAAIAEVGYQLPEVFAAPWLRLGLNLATGDGDADDDDHNTFFNLLPTNHKYYGYADQVAFQNLIDLFAQLRLEPHERFGLELAVHQLWLANDDDGRYFGAGAFSKDTLGFGSTPSSGSHDVGTELDIVGTVSLLPGVSLMAGYSVLWGGGVFDDSPSGENTHWAFAQLELRY